MILLTLLMNNDDVSIALVDGINISVTIFHDVDNFSL